MNSTSWAVAAVALVLGIGIGFGAAVVSRTSGGDEAVLNPEPAAARAPTGAAPVPAAAGTGPSAGAAPVAPGEGGAKGLLARAIAEVPFETAPPGNGTIGGTVKTAEGAPVAGVTVRAFLVTKRDARAREEDTTGAPPKEEDLETDIRNVIASRRENRANRREALTGADGAFEFASLPEGEFRLEAYKEGWEVSRKGGWGAVKCGATVDFEARALVEVPVDVLLPDGSRPASAEVEFEADPGGGRMGRRGHERSTPWSPARSVIWVLPGTYRVTASAPPAGGDARASRYRSDPQEATLAAGAPAPTLVLRLKGPVGIRGKVVLPPGLEAESVWVSAVRAVPGPAPKKAPWRSGDKSDSADREDGYAFSFEGLAPGNWTVLASLQHGGRVCASTTVEVADSMAAVELVVPPPAPGLSVVVRAFGPDGKPLRDLDIEMTWRSGFSSSSGDAAATPRADGSYFVLLEPPDEEDEVDTVDTGEEGEPEKKPTCTLAIRSPKYGKREVAVEPGSGEIVVRFQDPAFLEAAVTGYAGSGMEGKLRLVLKPAQAKSDDWRFRFDSLQEEEGLDEQGKQKLGPLEPGAYELLLELNPGNSDHFFDGYVIRRTPLNLPSGTTRTPVAIPTLYSLTVTLEKAEPNVTVAIRPAGESEEHFPMRRGKAGQGGSVVFESLPAGEYVVWTWGGSARGSMRVTVPAQADVRFEGKVTKALKVFVEDPEGALAKAGFQNGDLVIGVDGVEFTSEEHMQALSYGALSKDSVKMLVLRGTARLEIPMNPKQVFRGDGSLGGRFEPSSR